MLIRNQKINTMKFLICLIYFFITPFRQPPQMDWKNVIRDFSGKFNDKRFQNTVMLITVDEQKGTTDIVKVASIATKRKYWEKINVVFGRCDYIVKEDSANKNSFNIFSDKAYQKFWVMYDEKDQIASIKIIRPHVKVHLIPSPCGL